MKFLSRELFLAGDFYINSIGRGQKNLLYERQTGNA